MKKLFKKASRFLFGIRKRPLLRDDARVEYVRVIFKTPKVRKRRLSMKRLGDIREEKAARREIAQLHLILKPKYYTLQLSKRFPSAKRRIELYYDLPSLNDIVEGITNRRTIKLLNKVNSNKNWAQIRGKKVLAELEENFLKIDDVPVDFGADQFLVDGIDENGKFHLILVDI